MAPTIESLVTASIGFTAIAPRYNAAFARLKDNEADEVSEALYVGRISQCNPVKSRYWIVTDPAKVQMPITSPGWTETLTAIVLTVLIVSATDLLLPNLCASSPNRHRLQLVADPL